MTYLPAFTDEINREGARDFVLRPRYFTGTPYVGDQGLSFRGGTYDGIRYPAGLLSISPISRRVRPYRWQASHGTCEVTIDPSTIDPDSLRRGSVWQLIAFTRTASGALWTATLDRVRLRKDGSGFRYVLSLIDIAAMQARADTGTDLSLFGYAGSAVTTTNGAGASATTYRVTSTADFYARTEVGTRGLLLVKPDSSADPFLARWTAKTSTRFTVINADQYGTTKTNVPVGSELLSLGYFEGHPSRFAQELYTGSSPVGTRSLADSGYLRLPEDLWSQSDSESEVARTSDLEYAFWCDSPIQMDSAADWLGIGGFFVTMHHGRVTCRTVPDLGAYWITTVTSPTYPGPDRYLLSMSDLAVRGPGSAPIRLETDLYGSGQWQTEYLQLAVETQAGTAKVPSLASAEKRGCPTLSEYRIDLNNTSREITETVYTFPGLDANLEPTWIERTVRTSRIRAAYQMPQSGPAMYATTANNNELANRLSPYIVHAPQVVPATFAGPHPEYTLGDSVKFDDSWDLPAACGGTIAGLQGMIAGTSMDVLGLTHTLTIWIPPQRLLPFSAAGSTLRDPQG